MKRRSTILTFAASVLAIAPMAGAVTYTGSILYPLTLPADYVTVGFSSVTQAAYAGQVMGAAYSGAVAETHALMWNAAGTPVDLNPSQGFASYAYSADGAQQVGTSASSGNAVFGDLYHAILWSGTAASAIDLNPSQLGVVISSADAINGNQQVGYGRAPSDIGALGPFHALLWTGSSSSAVDLTPSGFVESQAWGTDGIHQVGSGYQNGTGLQTHALLWTSTANSAVDLNPTDLPLFTQSSAVAVSGNQQVGSASAPTLGYASHAMLWNSTADSAVDLNPSDLTGYTNSFAEATNGFEQVGYGYGAGNVPQDKALLWFGNADSAVDLNALLPAVPFLDFSEAYSVDSSGDIFGVAQTLSGDAFAVEWTPTAPIPEPAAASILFLTGAAILLRRRRVSCNA